MRKNNELDLKVTYETNHDLALASKMLPSLEIKIKEKIGDSYGSEIQNVCDRNCLEPEKIDELCLFFGSTYIKKAWRKTVKFHYHPPFGTSEMPP